MIAKSSALAALAFLLYGTALAGEIQVGAEAPALEGKTWVTADGKAPELQGKVQLIHFWFAG